jgi:hypothetical protein
MEIKRSAAAYNDGFIVVIMVSCNDSLILVKQTKAASLITLKTNWR